MRKLILLILLAIISSVFWAQNNLDCIPVVKEINNQINQVVVGTNDGGAIIAWQDFRNGNNYNIYAQRVSDDGFLLWQNLITGKLISGGDSQKENLSMVAINGAGAIIAWQDSRNGNTDIYAQWIDLNGDIAMSWPAAGQAICTDPSIQSPPKMVEDGLGGAFVVWSDNRGGDYDIWVRHILPSGALDPEKRIQLETETLDQINPAITSDGANGAIIAYEQFNGSDWDIFAQRIDTTNNNLWIAGGVPACIANLDQKNPSLVNDAVGSAIIVWEDYVNTTWDIYAQRVASVPPTGAIQWTANGVAIMAIALDQINPVIVAAGQYTAIIAWQHYLSATDSNIYAHMISGGAAGTTPTLPWGAPVPVSTLDDSLQRNPQAVEDGSGGIIVAYETGENLAANGYDIYANHLDATGGFTGAGATGGYAVCTWDTDQTKPMITYSPTATNNVIYAWLDKRNEPAAGIHDIYTLGEVAEIYTLNVYSTGYLQPPTDIYRNSVDTGFDTNHTFTSYDVNDLIGSYTPGPAPEGYYWVTTPLLVYATDFTEANNWTYTITFVLEEDQLPVELSNFTAILTAQNFVQLTWVSQSESQLVGYRVYRNISNDQSTSSLIDHPLIPATNTSTIQTYTAIDEDVEIGITYYYWLESVDYISSDFYGPVSVTVEGNVPPVLPTVTSMKNAYPNPFKTPGSTNIEVSLKAGESGIVTIYNTSGQIVKTINVSEGYHTLNWDGRDTNNKACANGIYFYKLTTPSFNQTRKMMLIK